MSNYILQKTICAPVSISGIGVHSGKQTRLTIRPAPDNHGIKFRRTDLPGTPDIQALFKRVVDTSLATVIGIDGVIVSTIEHLMSSFAGLGIDNALVEIDNYEVPIIDGSARVFTREMKTAGIKEQAHPKHFFIIKKPVRIDVQDKSVEAIPHEPFKVTCNIDFDHPLIGQQTVAFERGRSDFEKEICSARTFGFLKDQALLKKFSLGKGGSLDNAIIIDKDRVLNEEGLRYPDEFVRHKLLDCLGDFSLLGMPILGHITTQKSGHTLNHLFIETLLENKDAWSTGMARVA